MYCPLGNHLLRGQGVFITNPRHIRFVNKYFVDFLPSEKVCEKCKQDIKIAYEYKMKRAINLLAKNVSLISSSTSDDAPKKGIGQGSSNKQKRLEQSTNTSFTDDDDDDRPTTSAQAALKRKRREERQRKGKLPINIQRGARLPHIQPAPRRRQFIHANPDIMDIYLRGTTGG